MKFGEYLRSNKNLEWDEQYLNYDKLKNLIKNLHTKLQLANKNPDEVVEGVGLSVPPPTNAAGQAIAPLNKTDSQYGPHEGTQEEFYYFLESEMKKIELFTRKKVKQIRTLLEGVENDVNSHNEEKEKTGSGSSGLERRMSTAKSKELSERVDSIGSEFLQREKYVNMNFTGLHKILKKHDRWLPNPCKAFYLTRLHDQSWVRGDYSDVIVSMSRVYSALRGDEKVAATDDAKQDFVRSTRKYWVRTEDISRVKYIILQHLPVFLQKEFESGETDSQLVNSVYVDNYAMELYHGRLDKTPGAIALRFRWYGTGLPRKVFIERKTHREGWCGDISVKERFIVDENQVRSLLDSTLDLQAEVSKMRAAGRSESEVSDWLSLASEITRAIASKQLRPVMRTQYMRTAFQIPFDATVRISLDCNLCMILDRTKETSNGDRWYRDPEQPVPLNQITRFPHAVLEVKLQLEGEDQTPDWVTELLDSGMLMEVHKFSKFIHGCAILLPDEVRAAPYWIDDTSLKTSIERSGAGDLLEISRGANEHYTHLLPHDDKGVSKAKTAVEEREIIQRQVERRKNTDYQRSSWGQDGTTSMTPLELETSSSDPAYYQGEEGGLYCGPVGTIQGCDWADANDSSQHIVNQKVEPKLFFANERTFLKWLKMSVLLSGISTAVLAFTKKNSQASYYAMCLLPIALIFVYYGLRTFLWRRELIQNRADRRWDDPTGPILLTSLLILSLSVMFVLKLQNVYTNGLS